MAGAGAQVEPSPAACVSQACAALLPPRPFCERVRDVLRLWRANSLLTNVQPSASGPTVSPPSGASALPVVGSARRGPLLFLARRPLPATAAVRSVLLLVERTSSEGPSRDVDSGWSSAAGRALDFDRMSVCKDGVSAGVACWSADAAACATAEEADGSAEIGRSIGGGSGRTAAAAGAPVEEDAAPPSAGRSPSRSG